MITLDDVDKLLHRYQSANLLLVPKAKNCQTLSASRIYKLTVKKHLADKYHELSETNELQSDFKAKVASHKRKRRENYRRRTACDVYVENIWQKINLRLFTICLMSRAAFDVSKSFIFL